MRETVQRIDNEKLLLQYSYLEIQFFFNNLENDIIFFYTTASYPRFGEVTKTE